MICERYFDIERNVERHFLDGVLVLEIGAHEAAVYSKGELEDRITTARWIQSRMPRTLDDSRLWC